MALPPVKVTDSAGNTVDAATFKLKVPYNTAIKTGTQVELLQPANKNRLTVPMDGRFGSVSGINIGTYAITVLADATNNWLTSQSPGLEPDIGQRVWVSATTTVPGGLTAGTDYYVVNNIKQGASGGIQLAATAGGSVIDITTTGTGTVRVTPMDRPFGFASGTRPTSGVGGTPTIAVNSSSPCSLAADFLFTSDGFVGAYASWPFTIDASEKGQVLVAEFKYLASSALNLGSQVWVHDITNGALIPVTPYLLSYTPSLTAEFSGSFQTSSNSTSYELIIFRGADSAALGINGTIKINEVSVARKPVARGPMISDWITYTPTFSAGFGAVVTQNFEYRRVGDSLQIRGTFTTAVVANTTARISLPTGLTAVKPNGASVSLQVGMGTTGVSGSAAVNNSAIVFIDSAQTQNLSFSNIGTGASGNNLTEMTVSALWGNTTVVSLSTSPIKIQGWGSSQILSSDEDGRVCSFAAYKSGGSAFTADTAIPTWTTLKDSHGGFDSSTGIYTVKVPGDYFVSWSYRQTAAAAGSAAILKNGSSVRYGVSNASVDSKQVTGLLENLKAGDTIAVSASVGATLSTSTQLNHWSIHRLSGPSQIAASETVKARYTTSAGQSIPNATDTIVNFGTKETDSHGFVTTGASWRWTCGSPGWYAIEALATFTSNASSYRDIGIFKNGSRVAAYESPYHGGGGGIIPSVPITTKLDLLVGDYIDVRVNQATGGALALYASGMFNYITITRQGT